MRVRLRSLDGVGAEVLAGAPKGRKCLAMLLELCSREPIEPEPIFLDFGEVEVATASFLRESVLSFRDMVRRRRSNYYPVVANSNEVIEDEIRMLVAAIKVVVLICDLDDNEVPHNVRIMGDLDLKQKLTFDLIMKKGETDATELMRENDEGVIQTAWNNRLAGLSDLGLVVEAKVGRAKRYRPLFEER